jgi:hypothetical protein
MFTAFEPTADLKNLEHVFFEMFSEEWRLQRGEAPLGRVAIIDDDPAGQYLYPEMRLFERMFARFGAEAAIADAKELIWHEARLWHGARRDSVARDWRPDAGGRICAESGNSLSRTPLNATPRAKKR